MASANDAALEDLDFTPRQMLIDYVRTDSETATRLGKFASRLDCSRNYLINQAIEEYLDLHAWQIDKIQEGIEAVDRGQTIPHDDVMAEMDALIQEQIDRHESPT